MLRELAPCGQRRPERGNTHPCRFYHLAEFCTGRMGLMAHRKLKETKQQPGTAGPANMLGCCLVSFHFRCDVHPICPVDDIFTLNSIPMNKADPTSFEALKWENFPSKTDRTEPINSLLPPLPHRWSLFRSSSSSRRSARSRAASA